MLSPKYFLQVIPALLLLLCWTVPGTAIEGTCQDASVNQPIGIDFGPQFIIASYAHPSGNFTPLAFFDKEDYQLRLRQLWREYYDQHNLNKLYGFLRNDVPLFTMLKETAWHYLSDFAARFEIFNHPYVHSVRTTTSWAYDSVFTQVGRVKGLLPLPSRERDTLTMSIVAETFVGVFEDIKASARANHDMNITFALIGVPDFFNSTVTEVILEASRKAGIETAAHALPRSFLSYFNNPMILPEDSTVLVLHQGQSHCGIRLRQEEKRLGGRRRRGKSREQYLPLEPWKSENLYRRLAAEVLRSNDMLKMQIEVGADEEGLMDAVVDARLRLKRLDPVVGLPGVDSRPAVNDNSTTVQDDDDGYHPLDEVPLDLDAWWVYGENPGVKLTREQVLAADNKYVKSLGQTISTYLEANQQARTDTKTTELEETDRVVILTDWVDGDLVRRAIQEALGNEIPILGGTLQNITMAADGAARLASKRRGNLLLRPGASKWPLGHDEL
ncbi:hypothetical protein BDW59DRAFT_154833 [Aspergillus cavernicola]|uniref:Uncharacterized protein n=1 Tax=Aspergillus cavernicola TaxID=176166 RepID=A0ABR4HDF8_9EURO